jgi:hypothetical protein
MNLNILHDNNFLCNLKIRLLIKNNIYFIFFEILNYLSEFIIFIKRLCYH